jgi:hypothetical protein
MPTRHTAVSLFSSWLGRMDLQGVDGLGELPGAPGAAAELAEDPPVLEPGRLPFRRGRGASREAGWLLSVIPVCSSPVRDLRVRGFPGSPLSASVTSPVASSSARTPQAGPPPASLTSAADRPGEHRPGQRHTRRQPRKREPAGRREPHRVRGGRDLYPNIVPSGPEGDAAYDVTVTPITGTGSVPRCDIPAFDPPLPGNLCDAPPGGSEVARGGPSLATT